MCEDIRNHTVDSWGPEAAIRKTEEIQRVNVMTAKVQVLHWGLCGRRGFAAVLDCPYEYRVEKTRSMSRRYRYCSVFMFLRCGLYFFTS